MADKQSEARFIRVESCNDCRYSGRDPWTGHAVCFKTSKDSCCEKIRPDCPLPRVDKEVDVVKVLEEMKKLWVSAEALRDDAPVVRISDIDTAIANAKEKAAT